MGLKFRTSGGIPQTSKSPVSYTHLDVYKRQTVGYPAPIRTIVLDPDVKLVSTTTDLITETVDFDLEGKTLQAVSYTHLGVSAAVDGKRVLVGNLKLMKEEHIAVSTEHNEEMCIRDRVKCANDRFLV